METKKKSKFGYDAFQTDPSLPGEYLLRFSRCLVLVCFLGSFRHTVIPPTPRCAVKPFGDVQFPAVWGFSDSS